MKRNFLLLNIFIGLMLLVLLPKAFAQDITPGATVEANTVTIVEPVPSPTSDPMIQLSLWQILAGFAAAFSLGGITIGTGIGVLASRLRHNETAMKAIEGLAASTPDSTVQMVSGLMDKFQFSLTESFALIREAVDKVPYASKTPEQRDAVLYPSEGGAQPGGPAAFRTPNRES
jgi:hypothetical protein